MSHSLGHGGGERQLALTALNIDRSRFEPHVGCCEGGFWVDRLRDAGVRFFFMGPRSLVGPSALREARRLRAYIREHGIRIVQSFDYSMNVLGDSPGEERSGCDHDLQSSLPYEPDPAPLPLLNLIGPSYFGGIVVNSEALRRHLAEDYSIPARKIFTCYNGIDTAVFHPAARAELPGLEGLDWNTISRRWDGLRAQTGKESRLVARGLSGRGAAIRPDIRLLITGSGPEEPALRALAAAAEYR